MHLECHDFELLPFTIFPQCPPLQRSFGASNALVSGSSRSCYVLPLTLMSALVCFGQQQQFSRVVFQVLQVAGPRHCTDHKQPPSPFHSRVYAPRRINKCFHLVRDEASRRGNEAPSRTKSVPHPLGSVEFLKSLIFHHVLCIFFNFYPTFHCVPEAASWTKD